MDLKQASDTELEEELVRRKKLKNAPIPLPNELTNYDQLRERIIREVTGIIELEGEHRDFEHYIYEAAMEAVYGKTDFWLWNDSQPWNK